MSSHSSVAAQQRTLLIIDDDELVRRSFSAYLEDSGYLMLEAETGAQGIDLFLNESPDLILCDLRLPDADGLDIVRHISESSQAVPVIVISGHGAIEEAVDALKYGAIDYLVKPIADLQILEDSIEKGLQAPRMERFVPQQKTDAEKSNQELENSLEHLRDEQEAGLEVQKGLLPRASLRFGDIQCAYRMVPSLMLSGDFVDYWEINQKELLFYIADVSGHGLSSAFVTILLKYFARDNVAKVLEKDENGATSAAQYLSQLNNTFCEASLDKHVTMIIGILNKETRHLRYAIAGHYPALILTQEKRSEFLQGKGFPLGVKQNAEYDEHQLELKPNFTLSLFSDGVLDVIQGKDLDEKEKKLLALVDNYGGDLKAIEIALNLDFLEDMPDDIALLNVTQLR